MTLRPIKIPSTCLNIDQSWDLKNKMMSFSEDNLLHEMSDGQCAPPRPLTDMRKDPDVQTLPEEIFEI